MLPSALCFYCRMRHKTSRGSCGCDGRGNQHGKPDRYIGGEYEYHDTPVTHGVLFYDVMVAINNPE